MSEAYKKPKEYRVQINKLLEHIDGFIVENKTTIKPTYALLLYYIYKKSNTTFWKESITLTKNEVADHCLINSFNTFKSALSCLSNLGIIKVINKQYNQYSNYTVSFHDDIIDLYFEDKTPINPSFAIGYSGFAPSKFDEANGENSDFAPSKIDEANGENNDFAPSKIDEAKKLPNQKLTRQVSKIDEANRFTPYYNNIPHTLCEIPENSHTKNDENGDKKGNEIIQVSESELSEKNVCLETGSLFYGWEYNDIEIYEKNKKKFYKHQHRIFDENMRQLNLSRAQIEKFAVEFWDELRITGEYKKPYFNKIASHFYFYLKKYSNNGNNNNNSEKRQQDYSETLNRADSLIEQAFRKK
jgi:hypothetical protein